MCGRGRCQVLRQKGDEGTPVCCLHHQMLPSPSQQYPSCMCSCICHMWRMRLQVSAVSCVGGAQVWGRHARLANLQTLWMLVSLISLSTRSSFFFDLWLSKWGF